ncbi:MAG: thermonuclease family protein [Alphaproteobacteria bacterium]|nr:thermonuclease family protein [Alphaproteobacteria bacterium]
MTGSPLRLRRLPGRRIAVPSARRTAPGLAAAALAALLTLSGAVAQAPEPEPPELAAPDASQEEPDGPPSAPTPRDDPQAGLAQSFAAEAAAALGARALQLTDGRVLVLPHLIGPLALAPGAPGQVEAERAAARALADRTLGRRLRIDLAGAARDRLGRLRGRVQGPDGGDLAEDLVRAGWLFVLPEPDADPERLAALLAAEAAARAARAGLWDGGPWGPPPYRLEPAEPFDGPADRFVLVEGEVRRVGRAGQRRFLEFGPDWRRDFTAGLDAAARRRFERAGVDLEILEGARVRVRGWLRWWNGPYLDLDDPRFLERVDAPGR